MQKHRPLLTFVSTKRMSFGLQTVELQEVFRQINYSLIFYVCLMLFIIEHAQIYQLKTKDFYVLLVYCFI